MKNVALLTVLALAGVASAESITYSSSFALARTNWADTMTLPKFDPSLGVLDSVAWTVGGGVQGNASFESLDAAPAMISTALSARVTLSRPDLSPLQVVIPVVNNTDSVSAFDGSIDFSGTSGKAYNGLTASDSGSSSSSSSADLALFTATFSGETIVLNVTAEGASTASTAYLILTQA